MELEVTNGRGFQYYFRELVLKEQKLKNKIINDHFKLEPRLSHKLRMYHKNKTVSTSHKQYFADNSPCGAIPLVSVSFTSELTFYVHTFCKKKIPKNIKGITFILKNVHRFPLTEGFLLFKLIENIKS